MKKLLLATLLFDIALTIATFQYAFSEGRVSVHPHVYDSTQVPISDEETKDLLDILDGRPFIANTVIAWHDGNLYIYAKDATAPYETTDKK